MRAVFVGILMLGQVGCAGEPVGEPCAPEYVPEGGFDELESYVEVGSLQCETRTCLVHGLEGDLSSPDADRHVYCSCRCNGGDGSDQACACPDGFACEKVLNHGGPAVAGSYCVRQR